MENGALWMELESVVVRWSSNAALSGWAFLSRGGMITHVEFNDCVSKRQLKSHSKKAHRLSLCGKSGLDCMECGSFILDS